MNLSIIGAGYIGLVTGTCFAEKGNNVTCIDIDKEKIKKMKAGEIPIYEPELEYLFKRNISEGRLHFTTSLEEGIKGSIFIFLALPTPPDQDGSADLSYVLGAAKDIGKNIKSYTVIINKSTVPVGTAKKVYSQLAEGSKTNFDVVSNPEFLREGFAVQDFMKPDRVVIGSSSEKAKKLMRELYAPFVRQGNPILEMDEISAELAKYTANAFLATKISFMNDIANLAEIVGANVDDIRLAIGADNRIGKRFLFPGIGYGGSCFPKDVKAIIKTAKSYGYNLSIIESTETVNNRQKTILIDKIKRHYQNIKGLTFALWGLSFKPDTDDIREAPSLDIISLLTKAGSRVVAYDPAAMDNVKKLLSSNKKLDFSTNQYDALKDADGLIIATDWSEFQNPDLLRIKKSLRQPVIFDGRNLFNPFKMAEEGFHYESIGRVVAKR